jgi:hypothetical protein
MPWRQLAGALPAVALVGSGVALAFTGGNPQTQIVTDSAPLIKVPDKPLGEVAPIELPPLPELPAPKELAPTPEYQPSILPGAMTVTGIPAQALAAYKRAATLVDAADPGCRIDWALIAAIGKVESNHGRYGGNGIDKDGTVRPGIYGIPLNGQNATAVIKDTDGGAFDRDSTWDRAVGPMQFIPGTWRTVGVDANGDGRKDPQNIVDASTATAVYLCSGPGDLSTTPGARAAVLRYNQSDAYADQVLAIAAGYRGGYTVVPDAGLTEAQRSGSPFLPTGEPQTMATYDPVLAAKPAPKPKPKPTTKPKPKPSEEGTVEAGGSKPGSGSTPKPSTTAGTDPVTGAVGGVTDTVGGIVGGVVGGVTGQTPTPKPSTSTPKPSGTTTPRLPLEVLPVGGKCPDGYDEVLGALGIVILCTLSK